MLSQYDKSTNSPNVLIRRRAVEERTGLKRSSLYGLMRLGHFPRPVKLSTRSVAWVLSDVDDWVNGRLALSRDPHANLR